MQPDRPDQSEGTSVLSPRRLQIEWGVGTSSGHHNMGLMLRYGLVPDLELRLEGLLQRPHRGGSTGLRSHRSAPSLLSSLVMAGSQR